MYKVLILFHVLILFYLIFKNNYLPSQFKENTLFFNSQNHLFYRAVCTQIVNLTGKKYTQNNLFKYMSFITVFVVERKNTIVSIQLERKLIVRTQYNSLNVKSKYIITIF